MLSTIGVAVMWSKVSCILTLFVVLVCSQVQAQDAVSRNHYGKGVQAYNRGNISTAQQHFQQALNYGSQDPRVYYFLGLTKLRSGDTYGAESDFNAAATLEYSGKRKYNVGMALSRVQGGERLQLERVRRATRAAVRSMPKPRPRKPTAPMPRPKADSYNEFDHAPLRKDASDVTPNTAPQPDTLDDGFGGDLFDNGPSDDAGGFDTDFGGTVESGDVVSAVMRALFNAGGKAVPTPEIGVTLPGRMPAAAAGEGFGTDEPDTLGDDDVFGEGSDDTNTDDGGDLDDVFGDDDSMSEPETEPGDAEIDPFADDPMEEETDDLEEDDLFGDDPPADPPADDDPFGDDPGEAPAGEDDPFGGDDDPFGEGGDDPFGEDPGGEAPAGEDDPFGGDDDPFGL